MNQVNRLVDLIRKFDGISYVTPTIELKPYQNKKKILKILNMVIDAHIDYFIFKSVNAVSFFITCLNLLQKKEKFLKKLKNASIIAIGPKTSVELKNNGIESTIIPKKYSSEGIMESMKEKKLRGKFVVIPCPKNIRNSLTEKLKDLGANVLKIPIYEIALPKDQSKILTLIEDIIKGNINIITFTSSCSALNLVKVASKHKLDKILRDALNERLIAVIGPVTQKTLGNLDIKTDIMPNEFTVEAMVNSIIRYLYQERKIESKTTINHD